MNAKKWVLRVISLSAILLLFVGILTVIVDPYFHYHKPLKGLKYRLYEERYINDGIGRNFDYDAIITGNSLTENFKTSEFDKLYQVNSVKLPYSGAGYKEIWENLDRALARNGKVKKVIVALDFDDLIREQDWVRYDEYPEYLYDDNLWNDVFYIWNKDVLYRGTCFNLFMTITDRDSTSFDEYASWQHGTGKDKVLSQVTQMALSKDIAQREYTQYDLTKVTDNINNNIVRVINKYPDTEFYLYFSPASIAKWYTWYGDGEIIWRTEAENTAIKLLIPYHNVCLFSFLDQFDWVSNLDNYSDTIHYTNEINSEILLYMNDKSNALTVNNYEMHKEQIQKYYLEYPYEQLFQ